MKLNNKELENILDKKLSEDVNFKRVSMIVRANSFSEDIWLIGGKVYQTLANEIYGVQGSSKDYDFIVKNPVPSVSCPPNWKMEVSTLGCPRMIQHSEDLFIDFIPLTEIYSIKKRFLEPTINSFLSGTPLDIQSMAYNLKTKTIEGDLGIRSLENRTVKINNLEMAKDYSIMKKIEINNYLSNIAKNINFKAELIQ